MSPAQSGRCRLCVISMFNFVSKRKTGVFWHETTFKCFEELQWQWCTTGLPAQPVIFWSSAPLHRWLISVSYCSANSVCLYLECLPLLVSQLYYKNQKSWQKYAFLSATVIKMVICYSINYTARISCNRLLIYIGFDHKHNIVQGNLRIDG